MIKKSNKYLKAHYIILILQLLYITSYSCDSKTIDPTEIQLSNWTLSGTTGTSITSICDGYTVLGGYNIAGQGAALTKTFYGLPRHQSLKIKWFLFAIGKMNHIICTYKLKNR